MMFAIYTLAVTSLSEVECEITFQENKHSLLGKYQKACRQALINARFLQTSDLMVLQAYVLFLVRFPLFQDALVVGYVNVDLSSYHYGAKLSPSPFGH